MAVLSASERDNLPDSAFAYIQPGGHKVNGRTVPQKLRHFPIHDAAHVRDALARIAQGARFGAEAKPKVLAAAHKFGIKVSKSDSTGRSFDSLYPEVRFLADVPEIRSIGDEGPSHITGYAAAFGKLSRRLGGFVERVMPSAFNEARQAGYPDVVCRYNHDPNMVLGTTGSGTLILSTDERGLRYDVTPPACRSDVMEYVQRGDVRYSSFAFRCVTPGTDDEWGVTDYGYPMRSLHNVSLLDVAPVLDPAYRDTSAVARNMNGAVESLAAWVDAEPAEVRSMLEAGQAMRLFKRTDRSSVPPEHDQDYPTGAYVPSPVRSEERNKPLDDPAIALRNWTYETSDDDVNLEQHVAETRALHGVENMCMRYTDGEPCVRGSEHEGEHSGRCWGRADGLPCARVNGHAGAHTPMQVDDDSPQRGRPKKRDGNDTEDAANEEQRSEAKRTLSGPEALLAVMEWQTKLTSID